MARVVWSPAAADDLESIADFVGQDSTARASMLVSHIIDAAEKLADYPKFGRVIPEIGQSACREIMVRPYRIMYRIARDEIRITGIVHGGRDWPNPPTP